MTNDSVIQAMIDAVSAKPEDLQLRLHLAELLIGAGRHHDAAAHLQFVLSTDPANIKALQGLQACALESGDSQKAEGYTKLLAALTPGAGQNQSQETNASNVSQFPAASGKDHTKDQPHNDEAERPVRLKLVEDTDNVTLGPWEDMEPRISLSDVGGMESVKKRLDMAFLAPLRNPELMKMYGKSLSGGMMLYGPPGCGKTFIARALAGELGAKFISVGLSDVLDMWLGESERKLHELFETARRNAPVVLFFDEVDALGQKRSQLKHSAGRNIVNQLLAEMDSVGNENKNVFILAATNHPWDVDTALRRPGRFDRTVLVLPPDIAARASILEYHLKDRPTESVNSDEVAKHTQHYSGADLAHLCETALEYALQDSIESGQARPVTMSDFKKALDEVRPSTRPWFETARNYAMFANEGGTYDELLEYIREQKL